MKTAVATLLLFTAVFWSKTEALTDEAADCCLSTSGTQVPRGIAKSYVVQSLESGCPIRATVFTTKRNRKLCSPPTEDKNHPWVKKLTSHLDKLASSKN